MKTVGNDLVRHQLHENRKWYLGLGTLLVLFGIVLLASLPFATLSVVFLFGVLMMIGGMVHLIAGIKIFDGAFRWLWLLFGILYFVAGYYAFGTPVKTAIVLTNLLAIVLNLAVQLSGLSKRTNPEPEVSQNIHVSSIANSHLHQIRSHCRIWSGEQGIVSRRVVPAIEVDRK